ncbi:NACHT, LRR and PYD domains-containing protein 6 [Frankliniella fusca]|uniref:NACHT, LRR and PYD domains-containing protein 6 n=1 Tax=Frankliniella fusca TaxID=407009 RepID=A0AAE1L6A5_9NEOP|nr:NACHT, LRR and PYD domains-containing protein 6 [Frankliniella fusca]
MGFGLNPLFRFTAEFALKQSKYSTCHLSICRVDDKSLRVADALNNLSLLHFRLFEYQKPTRHNGFLQSNKGNPLRF